MPGERADSLASRQAGPAGLVRAVSRKLAHVQMHRRGRGHKKYSRRPCRARHRHERCREAPEEAMPQRQRTRTGEGLVQTGPGCPEARDESCVSPAHVENAREARRGRPLSRGGARRSPRRADKSQREIILAGAISPSFLFPSLLGELQSHSSYISSNSSRCQSSLRAAFVCPCASPQPPTRDGAGRNDIPHPAAPTAQGARWPWGYVPLAATGGCLGDLGPGKYYY